MTATAPGRAGAPVEAPVFRGFLPQITGHLGPVRWVEPPTAEGGNRGFAVLFLGAPGSEVGTAVTSGLRFQKIAAPMPQELCCTLLIEHEEVAHQLVVEVAHQVLAAGVGLGSGARIPCERPLAFGSPMVGVVCAGHPFAYAETEFEVMALIPASAAELAFAGDQGTDALFDLWEKWETDLADLSRPCVLDSSEG